MQCLHFYSILVISSNHSMIPFLYWRLRVTDTWLHWKHKMYTTKRSCIIFKHIMPKSIQFYERVSINSIASLSVIELFQIKSYLGYGRGCINRAVVEPCRTLQLRRVGRISCPETFVVLRNWTLSDIECGWIKGNRVIVMKCKILKIRRFRK